MAKSRIENGFWTVYAWKNIDAEAYRDMQLRRLIPIELAHCDPVIREYLQ